MKPYITINTEKNSWSIQHHSQLVSCDKGVVCHVSLSYEREYIRQMGRCVNTWLKGRRKNIIHAKKGHVSLHDGSCVNKPAEFNKSVIVYRQRNQCVRQISLMRYRNV